jgi:adenine-specific DNA-methyltransferase
MPKQRLELTWIGKGEEPQLEPRLLIEDPDKSYGEAGSENMLIHGDNLLAIKALEQEYAGKVKCVCIDPPYNTGSAFVHYDDGVEHSLWLSLMSDRIKLLRDLMAEDGTMWVFVDDREAHYLKVMMDEIFGRSNFISNVIWQKKYAPANDAKWISESHDHVLVYAKLREAWRPNKIEKTEEQTKAYKNRDNDERGRWRPDNYKCNKNADERPNLYYSVINPNTKEEIWPQRTAVWRYSKDRHEENVKNDRIWWGVNGDNKVPAFKRFLSEVSSGIPPQSIWTWQEVGHNQDANREQQALDKKDPFSTPKPEKLIHRILHIATDENDLVLDSFMGSGTTGAVAHKMGRRWIGIELGEHANTHCLPRLKKVVEGLDEGGITKAQNWKGGGGFKFYNLAPSLLRKDDLGQWVIDEAYNADQLAAAMAKHEGYTYAPDADRYWKQAYSTENDYLYTTTQLVTPATVDHILEQLGPEESLLICCKAYQSAAEARDPRINLHKIPASLTDRCEFGKDDYSLNIIDAPKDEEAEAFVPAGQLAAKEAEAEELRKYGKQKEMFD